VAGRPRLLADWGLSLTPALQEALTAAQQQGRTAVAAGWDGKVRGLLVVADTVKPTSAEAVAELKRLGLRPVLLTGDNEAAARAVAAEVGIDEVIAEVLPSEKVDAVRRLQAEGRVVAMVGDGVNDAAALAAADLGLAMGTGTDVAIEASDLTLVRGDLRAVGDALRLARRTLATIKGNLFWAFAYNLAALPLAALGLLNPLIAVRRWRSAASSWSPTACGCAASPHGRREGDWCHERPRQHPARQPQGRPGLVLVGVMAALMWVLEIVDSVLGGRLDALGIEPREVESLPGVVLAPFLHGGFGHLISNTVPLLVLGALVAFSGLVRVLKVTALVVLVGGLGIWLVAPGGTIHLGASILVFGYAAYLIARGLFDRRFAYLAVGVVVAFVYGTGLLIGLLPRPGISWQGHLFGALGGLLAAKVLAQPKRRQALRG
jgi:membrane associated rhomboid family serine protease/soluble P-type ATPase